MTRVSLLGLFCAVILAAQTRPQISFERIRDAGRNPADWLTYSGAYQGTRYSTANQINASNVSALRPAWVHQLLDASPPIPGGVRLQVTPLVADGVMYVTLPRAGVKALDLRTGRQLWSYEHSLSPGVRFSSMANRGAALLDGRLFFGTLDAYLIALDATSGELLWKTKVADHQIGYSITSAPLALKDKIVTGISGGEFGVRGFLDAYDPETGKRLWRFWTIPEPGEPGHETWQGEAWKTGGGPTWITGSYDPEANLILWGTGNPSPLFNGDVRPGDNLYTDSLVALDADTGELRWHFQFTPHDQLDLDAAQIPVLVDRTFGGALRKLVLFANRNGFFYVLDRLTGKYLLGRQYGPQTWAKGLDEKGRPIPLPQGQPSTEGARIVPASGGITNWNSPSYSPQTGLLYVAMREDHATYVKQSDPKYSPGVVYPGGATVEPPESEKRGAIIALSPETGDIVWRTNLQSAPWGGVHATAGGLVFGGTSDGWAFALDARNGKILWHFNTGGEIRANPISFVFEGRQHFLVAAGLSLFSCTLPD